MSSRFSVEADAIDVLDAAFAEHHPVAVYAMFSGGHDSLATAALTSLHPRFTACVHVNTGIGIDETREFVRETCRREGWPLIEKRSPIAYDDMVMQYGFPSGAGHRYAYIRLKERAIEDLMREAKVGHPRSARVALVTGVRRQESKRRMGHVEAVRKVKGRVWVAPLLNWSKLQVEDYIEARGLPRNQVVDLLHMSGECLCGAMAEVGELAWISKWYPAVGKRIADLQDRALAAGQPRCKWGSGKIVSPDQLDMCWSCEARVA